MHHLLWVNGIILRGFSAVAGVGLVVACQLLTPTQGIAIVATNATVLAFTPPGTCHSEIAPLYPFVIEGARLLVGALDTFVIGPALLLVAPLCILC